MAKCFSIFLLLVFGFFSCSAKDENNNDAGMDLSTKDVVVDQMTKDAMTDKGGDIRGDISKDLLNDLPKDSTLDLLPNQPLILIRSKDGAKFTFTDFYYGKNNDGTLRIETMVKGTGSCPTMNDPTPEETMIINIDPVTGTHKEAVVLDFEGHFETVNPNHSTTLIVSEFSFDEFGQTFGMQISGVDKHDVSHFSFEGQVYATYCPSLDE